MVKLIKKAAVCMAAFAVAAAGIFAGNAADVKAAEPVDTTLHISVNGAPEGTDQIAINMWGGAWVDTDDYPNLKEVTSALTAWGWGDTWAGNIDMTQDADGMYTCTIKYDADQFASNGDNYGIQIFMYGAENAAVAASYNPTEFYGLLASETTDVYAVVDYTNASGADGATVVFQTTAPSVDDGNDDGTSDDTQTDDGTSDDTQTDDGTSDDTQTDDGTVDDTQTGDSDTEAGDGSALIAVFAAAAAAAATIAASRKKTAEN